MARKAQGGSVKRERLLEAAQKLMLAKGYAATSVDEICATAGVTKGSFFHYFKSKEDVGRTVLDHFVACRVQAMQTAPFFNKRDPLKRVYGYVDFLIKMSKDPTAPKSCLLGNFAQDLSDTHPEFRVQCAKHFSQWTEGLKRDLSEAKAKYASRAGFDTRSLAEYLIAILQGSLILAKAHQDMYLFEKNLRHYKRYIKDLFEERRLSNNGPNRAKTSGK